MQLGPGNTEDTRVETELYYKELCFFMMILHCKPEVGDVGYCFSENESLIGDFSISDSL